MQDQDLSIHEAFALTFEDELFNSLYVQLEYNENYTPEEFDTYVDDEGNQIKFTERHTRFNSHITSFKLEEIRKLKDEDLITLVDAALLIGERLNDALYWFIHDAPMIFAIATSKVQIDPREPLCKMSYSHIEHLPEWEEGCVYGRFEFPEPSWLITPKEAAEFAILRGYPPELFNDLLNPGQVKNEQPATQSFNDEEPSKQAEKPIDTDLLKNFPDAQKLNILLEAAIHFWSNADPNEKEP